MHVGFVGLGRMGGNLARSALSHGHSVSGYDRNPENARRLEQDGLSPATSLEHLVSQLPAPKTVFIYVPHGETTEQVVDQLRALLGPGDIAVDGGNSHWTDSERRARAYRESGIRFLDMGTSGGVEGAQTGACFMVGGERSAFDIIAPLLRDLAIDDQAVLYVGASGSGHFVKLVHNGIEFGMVQAIAEGVELLRRSDFDVDLAGVLNNWAHGSVIRSWLVELMRDAVAKGPAFDGLSTYVEDTQEVKWVLQWALDRDIPVPVISDAQTALMEYRDLNWPAAKAVALMRHGYGGHPVHTAAEPRRA